MKYVSYLVHLEIKREESLTLLASSLDERRIRSVDDLSQDLMLLYQYYVVDSSCETPTAVISDSVRADSRTIITEHVCVNSLYMKMPVLTIPPLLQSRIYFPLFSSSPVASCTVLGIGYSTTK